MVSTALAVMAAAGAQRAGSLSLPAENSHQPLVSRRYPLPCLQGEPLPPIAPGQSWLPVVYLTSCLLDTGHTAQGHSQFRGHNEPEWIT